MDFTTKRTPPPIVPPEQMSKYQNGYTSGRLAKMQFLLKRLGIEQMPVVVPLSRKDTNLLHQHFASLMPRHSSDYSDLHWAMARHMDQSQRELDWIDKVAAVVLAKPR